MTFNNLPIADIPDPLFTYTRTVTCGPTSFVATRPAAVLSTKQVEINSVPIEFSFLLHFSKQDVCPIESYEVFPDNTAPPKPWTNFFIDEVPIITGATATDTVTFKVVT